MNIIFYLVLKTFAKITRITKNNVENILLEIVITCWWSLFTSYDICILPTQK